MVRKLLAIPSLNRVICRWWVILFAWHSTLALTADEGESPDASTGFVWAGANMELATVIRMANLSGSLNALVDPWLETNASPSSNLLRQKVSFYFENSDPAEAMGSLLAQHGLAWRWNALLHIGRVTSSRRPNATNDAGPIMTEKSLLSLASTNVIDEIAFDEASLTDVLTRLSRETGLNVLWNAGRLTGSASDSRAPPKLSFSLKSVTGLQALVGVTENQGLALAWNPRSTVLRVITPEIRSWEAAHPMPAALPVPTIPSATNIQQLILLDAIPLDEVVAFLCRQAGISFILSPDLAGNTNNPTVEGKFKNLDTMRTLEALFENYGLAAVRDAENNVDRIVRRDAWRQYDHPPNPHPIPSVIDPDALPAQLSMQAATLESAIQILARQTGIDLLCAPSLKSASQRESLFKKNNVHFEFHKIPPRQALNALLANFGLAAIWDSAARIGHIVEITQVTDLTFSTAIPENYWGEIVPDLIFDEISLDIALQLLASQCDVRLESPLLENPKNINGSKVSLQFESMQPGRVFNAICASHRLNATWIEERRAVRITPNPAASNSELLIPWK